MADAARAADVIVVGAGPAGMAVAARAAKAGHRVVVYEREQQVGGSLRGFRLGAAGEFGFDDGSADMLLPAALRDLFRKSGRPLERELEVVPVGDQRRVVDVDGTSLALPLTGRGAQMQAVHDQLGERAAARWTALVDGFGERWDAVRQIVENDPAPPRLRALGIRRARTMRLQRRLRTDLAGLTGLPELAGATDRSSQSGRSSGSGARLAALAVRPVTASGQDADRAPGVLGALIYLERALGRWRPVGGATALRDALAARLALRGVQVRAGEAVTGLIERDGRIVGVGTSTGEQHADTVVTAVAPPQLRELLASAQSTPLRKLSARLARLRPAVVPDRTYLGVRAESAPSDYETLYLGEPLLIVHNLGDPSAVPAGHAALTVEAYGPVPGDVLTELAARGLNLGEAVVVRHDEPARPWAAGALFDGPTTARRLAPVAGVLPGLLTVGRSAYLPAGLPTELLSAALAAAEIGRASAGAPTTSA